MNITKNTKVVVLTGAGISAESGIKTFRDAGGLWENYNVEDVATPQAFNRNPILVWGFYKQRYKQSKTVSPNPAHYALVELENYLEDNFSLITQNVDNLHNVAGTKRIIEMHGNLTECFCVSCDTHFRLDEIDLVQDIPFCPECRGVLRPNVVWFGEIPYHLDRINTLVSQCDYFIVVGTSGVVYPAAGLLQLAKYTGAETIGINLEKPENIYSIDYFYQGKAGEILPKLVKQWIEESNTQNKKRLV